MPDSLKELLADERVLKCGVSIAHDAELLLAQYSLPVRGFVDLAAVSHRTGHTNSGLGLQPNRRCWNRDPPPNLRQSGGWTDLSESFKPFCSEHECGCEAAETLALGWQPQAMCNSMRGHKKGGGPKIVAGDLGRRLATTVPDDDDTGKALVGSGYGPWPPYPVELEYTLA